ncbi:MAG: NAD(P)/FAD-dependent oxidoreductase [Permianibacter sp.]
MSVLMDRRTDIAVIGSGIVGLCCAHYLQQQGEQVLVLDANGPAAGASFGNAGSISVGNLMPQATPGIVGKALRMLADPLAPLKLDWSRLPSYSGWLLRFLLASRPKQILPIIDALHAINHASRSCWLQLAEAIGANDLLAQSGYLHVYSEEASFADAAWERELMQARGVAFSVLDQQALRELEPQIGAGFVRAVFQHEALAMRDPADFCLRLAQDLQQRGVAYQRAAVTAITRVGAGYRLDSDHGRIHAARVVIAAGAWSNRLLRAFDVRLPLIPARGYHLMFAPGAEIVHRPTLWAERYMVITPMQHGIRMTSIKELTALDGEPHYHLIRRLLPEARKRFPGLPADYQAEWSGYRPCTPDSLPIIDQLPDAQIFLAFGHGHLGLTQAPITGALIAQRMTGTAPTIALTPYRWDRF